MKIRRCLKCMHPLGDGVDTCPVCGRVYGTSASESFALRPGTILDGKYLVGEMLGQGGFGITYLGFDLLLEQKVAIKEYFPMSTGMVSRDNHATVVWSTTMMGKTGTERGFDSFLKEARKMAKLGGIPGVVGVKSVFIENETAYIVMDYVEGETLQKKLEREGPMDFPTCVRLLQPVIRALEQVHAYGIIHRDISPDNIMVQPNGELVLLDLGAAKELDYQKPDGTIQSSQLVAKHGFSPFEQYARTGKLGPWTDVYAMAATIYYCCTGSVPLPAVDRIAEDSLTCRPNLTEDQFQALAQGMAVQAEKRIRSMAELSKRLEDAIRGRKCPEWLLPVLGVLTVLAIFVGIVGIRGGNSHQNVPNEPQLAATMTDATVAPQTEATVPIKITVMEEESAVDPTEETIVSQKAPVVGEIGSVFTYGSYEQDGFSSDGREPIEWLVLDKVDGKALLLSNQAIDCVPYNSQDTGCTWSTCSLRKWLNDTFYEKAFSAEEREWILRSRVVAHENPDFSTDPGMDTDDYIFLLSVDEVKYYLPNDSDRMCSPTEYTVMQGAFRNGSLGTCWWWLRTPGNTSQDASSVNSNGTIDTDDGSVNSSKGCVRPAIWIKTDN